MHAEHSHTHARPGTRTASTSRHLAHPGARAGMHTAHTEHSRSHAHKYAQAHICWPSGSSATCCSRSPRMVATIHDGPQARRRGGLPARLSHRSGFVRPRLHIEIVSRHSSMLLAQAVCVVWSLPAPRGAVPSGGTGRICATR